MHTIAAIQIAETLEAGARFVDALGGVHWLLALLIILGIFALTPFGLLIHFVLKAQEARRKDEEDKNNATAEAIREQTRVLDGHQDRTAAVQQQQLERLTEIRNGQNEQLRTLAEVRRVQDAQGNKLTRIEDRTARASGGH